MKDDELTPIWKALSDPTRRRILDLLKERPRTTGELCDAFEELSRFAVMKHLAVLEGAELVIVRPHGRERWNHLNTVPFTWKSTTIHGYKFVCKGVTLYLANGCLIAPLCGDADIFED